jgi:hypothetical protein
MAIFQDAEIETMLTDWGNVLTAGEISAACLLDDREELVLEQEGGGGQIVRRITATIRTSDFPSLVPNDPIEIDGVAYTVYQKLLLGDGALSELWLRLAEIS